MMRPSPIDFHKAIKRPHYQVHHLRRRSLIGGHVPTTARSAKHSPPSATTSAGPNPKNWAEKFDMYLKSYCDMTSLHGLRYFAESGRPWYERCFWLFAICLVIFGMVITIHSQVIGYISNPILMTLNSKVTPVNEVPFPAVTICSENQVRASLANISELLKTYKERNLTIPELANLEIVKLLCTDVNNRPVKFPPDTSYLNHFFTHGFYFGIKACSKVFKRFNWEGKVIDNPCTLMQVTTSFIGLCHSFNMIPPVSLFSNGFLTDFVGAQPISVMLQYPYVHARKQSSWTPDTGYVINTNRSGYEEVLPYRIPTGTYRNSANFLLDFGVDDIQEQCVPRGNGFLVILHSPNELPSLEHTVMYAEVDTRTVIHVTPQLTNTDEGLRSWKPEERGCYYNHERQLKFFAIYTTHNCNLECEANYTLKYCNCNVFYQPHMHSTPLCNVDKYECYHRSTVLSSSDSGHRGALYSACNCLPACNEIKYDIHVANQPRNWTYNTRVYYGIPENETKRNNYANILVLFRYKQVNSVIRVAIVSDSDFIANIGGLMGLFLGFSFISVFEIFYFSSIRWMTDVRKMNKWVKKWNQSNNEKPNVMKVPVAVSEVVMDNTDLQTRIPFVNKTGHSNINQTFNNHTKLPFANNRKNVDDYSKCLQTTKQLDAEYYYD